MWMETLSFCQTLKSCNSGGRGEFASGSKSVYYGNSSLHLEDIYRKLEKWNKNCVVNLPCLVVSNRANAMGALSGRSAKNFCRLNWRLLRSYKATISVDLRV